MLASIKQKIQNFIPLSPIYYIKNYIRNLGERKN